MAYPAGTSVAESILLDVISTLQGIDGTPDYKHELVGVYRDKGDDVFAIPDKPAAVVSVPRISYEDNTASIQSAVMDFTIRVVTQEDSDPQGTVRELVEDVKYALTLDVQRDGNALVTQITGDEAFQAGGQTTLAAADIFVTVLFRHAYGDPNTPV